VGSIPLWPDPGGCAVYGTDLWPLVCWDCKFESRLRHGTFFSCECCVLSCTGLCNSPITGPEQFWRVRRVWVWLRRCRPTSDIQPWEEIYFYDQHKFGMYLIKPFFLWRFEPIPSHGHPFTGFSDHTLWTHHTWYDSSIGVISPTHRPLPDNTQHSKEREVHAPSGILNHNPSKRAAIDPRLRPRSQWDRPLCPYLH
jgi:hypothetical protein